ncbi:MAG: O-antigen ligase family protein, partial [Bacteroidales bacterium]
IAYLMLAHSRRNFCSFACLRWVSFAFVLASLLLFAQLLKAIFQTPDMVFSLENIFNWGYIAVNAQIGLHSSYAALYFAFSAAICLFSISNFRTWYGKTKWAYLWSAFAFIIALIFIFAVFVVGAKSGLLSLGSLFVLYFIYEIGFQKHYVKSAVTLLSFCLFVGSLIYFYPSVLNKMKDTFSTVQQMHLQKHELYQGSTAYRVYFWETALATIQDKPLFGYGTGDVKEALAPHYSDTLRNVLCSTIPEKDTYLIENHIPPYNPHNQFLQTSIAIGLLGLSVFLSIFVCGLYWAFRTRSILFATLNLLFLVNCLTESMLETQAGIVFFVFFYFLFFLYLYPKLGEKTETAILKEK